MKIQPFVIFTLAVRSTFLCAISDIVGNLKASSINMYDLVRLVFFRLADLNKAGFLPKTCLIILHRSCVNLQYHNIVLKPFSHLSSSDLFTQFSQEDISWIHSGLLLVCRSINKNVAPHNPRSQLAFSKVIQTPRLLRKCADAVTATSTLAAVTSLNTTTLALHIRTVKVDDTSIDFSRIIDALIVEKVDP